MSEETEHLCEFGFPGPLRNRLVAAVLSGKKTATSSLLVEYEVDEEPLPAPGERHTVIDSAGQPVAVIEVVTIDVIRLGDADVRLAIEEGEDYDTVAGWREAHERFWNEAVIPTLPAGRAAALTDDTPVVVERFRLVKPRR